LPKQISQALLVHSTDHCKQISQPAGLSAELLFPDPGCDTWSRHRHGLKTRVRGRIKKLPEILKKPAGDGRWRASADHQNTRRFAEQNAAQADAFKKCDRE
jgi:hypothetical protein